MIKHIVKQSITSAWSFTTVNNFSDKISLALSLDICSVAFFSSSKCVWYRWRACRHDKRDWLFVSIVCGFKLFAAKWSCIRRLLTTVLCFILLSSTALLREKASSISTCPWLIVRTIMMAEQNSWCFATFNSLK